jgi:vacuolar-type H+-ATPase subunit H
VRGKDRPEPPQPLATSTAERLTAIVEAAERAAVAVIDDAEVQARHRLEQAQAEADALVADRLASLDDLTDSLIDQAEAIHRQSEQLVASLEEARRRLASDQGQERIERRQAQAPRPSHLSAVDPVAEPAPARAVAEPAEPTELRAAKPEGTAAGARLLATQMAVSGSSREEIETRLRNGFEIEDTASILDAILGPEG